MNTDNMLRAIYRLSQKDGLSHEEVSDITNWMERAGPEIDTTLLQEKSRERISAIFSRFFD
jgi:hypothetical protein